VCRAIPDGLAQGSPPALHHTGWERMGAEPAGIGASSQPRASPPVVSVCSLQWNFIQAKAATALAQALQSNSSLASLE